MSTLSSQSVQFTERLFASLFSYENHFATLGHFILGATPKLFTICI